ncbi:MAG: hypothetical protein KBD78_08435 [Oligoflexales bacterium]|nr:hypothetical protein [Oligoflexales bacterium]
MNPRIFLLRIFTALLLILCFGSLISCLEKKPKNSIVSNEKSSEVLNVDMLVEDNFCAKYDCSEALAQTIKAQFLTLFNYLKDSPFKIKSQIGDEKEYFLKLTNAAIVAEQEVSKDHKNGLIVNTGLANAALSVAYQLEQSSYSLTLTFEDQDFNLYSFPMNFSVNHNTLLEINGSLTIDVLKVLPISLQHVVAALFDEVFSAEARSDNKLAWRDHISHTMLPLAVGEVTQFQVDLINEVLIPLCHSYSKEAELELDCDIVAPKLRDIKDVVKQKMISAGYSQDSVQENIINETNDLTSPNHLKNLVANPAMYSSRCVKTDQKTSSIFRSYQVFHFYFPIRDAISMPSDKLGKNMHLYSRDKSGWLLLHTHDYRNGKLFGHVESKECKLESSTKGCAIVALEAEFGAVDKFNSLCNLVNAHGPKLTAGVGLSFMKDNQIKDSNTMEEFVSPIL